MFYVKFQENKMFGCLAVLIDEKTNEYSTIFWWFFCNLFRSKIFKLRSHYTFDLMENIFRRLNLKDEPFSTYEAALDNEIKEIWNSLQTVDENWAI